MKYSHIVFHHRIRFAGPDMYCMYICVVHLIKSTLKLGKRLISSSFCEANLLLIIKDNQMHHTVSCQTGDTHTNKSLLLIGAAVNGNLVSVSSFTVSCSPS
ncbi:hypothetical protein ILYODFUR_033412 [Ilyodon furcidens]|uniref:Uncharacterized protein n=1 Tax=Ilyodon furcidens TaxID=33524 RepID=A0ABV0VJL9_9TELE